MEYYKDMKAYWIKGCYKLAVTQSCSLMLLCRMWVPHHCKEKCLLSEGNLEFSH